MGLIHIVGAGPGRADLLTVRAARLLALADAVLYDRLVSAEVLELVRPGAEMHDVGKEEGRQEEVQAHILELLEDCARRHEVVVRLKGGDPRVFGRGGEEWAWLAGRGWDVEVVPGVSSAVAVPALAGIPVTYRGVAGGFAVVTGHRRAGSCQEWAAYAGIDTLVILMGVGQRVEIASCLMRLGKDAGTPVAFIENGTTERERVVETTLGAVADVEVSAPAVMVVGEVVRLRRKNADWRLAMRGNWKVLADISAAGRAGAAAAAAE
ncbi:MAG: uroporphyrinogen-III C-methyltransferase [Candidatus Solibacter usitatus]|nr:uroporphyrinogen-III C-methyltransferase [Candidatus Solibacter usitatus]